MGLGMMFAKIMMFSKRVAKKVLDVKQLMAQYNADGSSVIALHIVDPKDHSIIYKNMFRVPPEEVFEEVKTGKPTSAVAIDPYTIRNVIRGTVTRQRQDGTTFEEQYDFLDAYREGKIRVQFSDADREYYMGNIALFTKIFKAVAPQLNQLVGKYI